MKKFCPRSPSSHAAELGFEPKHSGSRTMFLTILPTPYCALIDRSTEKDLSDPQGPNSAQSCWFMGLPLLGITVVSWRMFETVKHKFD